METASRDATEIMLWVSRLARVVCVCVLTGAGSIGKVKHRDHWGRQWGPSKGPSPRGARSDQPFLTTLWATPSESCRRRRFRRGVTLCVLPSPAMQRVRQLGKPCDIFWKRSSLSPALLARSSYASSSTPSWSCCTCEGVGHAAMLPRLSWPSADCASGAEGCVVARRHCQGGRIGGCIPRCRHGGPRTASAPCRRPPARSQTPASSGAA